MYKVCELYGDFEPWWLLDGWEEDITSSREFTSYEEAASYYKERRKIYLHDLPETKSRKKDMSMFWDPKDQRWCEECNEYLQQYHSLILIEVKSSLKTKGSSGLSGNTGKHRVMCNVKKK